MSGGTDPCFSTVLRDRNALAHFQRAHGNQKTRLRKRLREALAAVRPLEIGDGRHGGGCAAPDGSNSYEAGAVSYWWGQRVVGGPRGKSQQPRLNGGSASI